MITQAEAKKLRHLIREVTRTAVAYNTGLDKPQDWKDRYMNLALKADDDLIKYIETLTDYPKK